MNYRNLAGCRIANARMWAAFVPSFPARETTNIQNPLKPPDTTSPALSTMFIKLDKMPTLTVNAA